MRVHNSITLLGWFLLATTGLSQPPSPLAPQVAPGPDSTPPSKDTAVLELELPPDSSATLDGEAIGERRKFEFRIEGVGKYEDHALTWKSGADVQKRTITLRNGWRVRFKPTQTMDGPEIVPQFGSGAEPRFSGDRKRMVTLDSTLIAWDVPTGRLLRRIATPKTVRDAALDQEGRFALLAMSDGLVELWDLAAPKSIQSFKGHTEDVLSVGWSPNGELAATGDRKGHVMLWEIKTGRRIHAFGRPPASTNVVNPVRKTTFLPDGKRLFTGLDGDAILWDVETGRELRSYEAPDRNLPDIAQRGFRNCQLTADGKHVIGLGKIEMDRFVYLWDTETGKSVRSLDRGGFVPALFKSYTPLVLRSTPDGKAALLADIPEQVGASTSPVFRRPLRWDFETGQVKEFGTIPGGTPSFDITPDGEHAIVSNGDLSLWQLDPLRRVRPFGARADAFRDAVFLGDGDRVLMCTYSSVRLWDLKTGRAAPRPIMENLRGTARLLCLYPNNRWIVTQSRRNTSVRDVEQIVTARDLDGVVQWTAPSNKSIYCAAVSPDGKTIAFGMDDGRLHLHNGLTGAFIREILGPGNSVKETAACYGVAFSADGSAIAIARRMEARAWRTSDFKEIFAIKPTYGANDVALSNDGRKLVIFGLNNHCGGVWDLSTGQLIAEDKPANFDRLMREHLGQAFHPNLRESFNAESKEIAPSWPLEYRWGVQDARFTPDGRLAFTNTNNQARLWDMATGEELARLILFDEGEDWLVITPDGLFDGSPNAREKVFYRVGGGFNVVPVDRFYQDFYRPGLLAALFRGQRPTADVKLGSQKPPSIKLVSPVAGNVETTEVSVVAEITDEGGGVNGPWLMHNGMRVRTEGTVEKNGNVLRRTFKLLLAPGNNKIEVKAASADGSWESEPGITNLTLLKPLNKVTMHVLAVGVNKYADASFNLRFAAPDAKAVADLFRERGKGLFREVSVTVLTDADATREKIRDALKAIAATAAPEDVLVVFLAGHGVAIGQRYYFIPADFNPSADASGEENVRKKGLAGDIINGWLDDIKATKRVVIYDTCHAGAAMSKAGAGRDPFAFRGAIETLQRSNGAHTLAAAASGQEAKEVDELGHGVLTYALLAGVGGVSGGPLADRPIRPGDPSEVVTVLEWFSYAAGHVPRLTEKYFQATQQVSVNSADNVFPLIPSRK